MSFHVPESCRLLTGPTATLRREGNFGSFVLPPKVGNRILVTIASDGMDWEHVSVHAREGKNQRTPTWTEMCYIKDIFWDAEDAVMQLHPRRSEYVNMHPNVLHLWRPLVVSIPEPPSIMVGLKGVELGAPAFEHAIAKENA